METVNYENCPNCGLKITANKIFTYNIIVGIGPETTEFMKHYSVNKSEKYCTTCEPKEFKECREKYIIELKEAKQEQNKSIDFIPCINIQSPSDWNYETIGIVTSQCTMGTGFLSELSSDWNDFFGLESNTMNKKVLKAEESCLNILRSKTLNMNGNAVIGIDIDYAEVGSLRGMILVCMTGTAIRIKNIDTLSQESQENIKKLEVVVQKMKFLKKFSFISNAN